MESTEFQGTERFRIEGRLGSGTSGDVFRVRDERLGTVVALKTLHKSDPAAIYRFKKEFRALADVNHPNLVQLYELLSDGDRWFFTMELVDGLDFVQHTRLQPGLGGDDGQRFVSFPTPTAPPDVERLRDALRQLAEGLTTLHDLGKLHCDIKPSNIRVGSGSRVVLLDFGLVKEVFTGQLYETMDGEVAGTPAYMSPEQATGGKITPASDWYGVGVVLYETLTGRLPFSGGFLKVLHDKQTVVPRPPRELVADLPPDLSELCERLLARDAGSRPDGREVLRALGSRRGHSKVRKTLGTASSGHATFVGRRRSLAHLGQLFAQTLGGHSVVALVHGTSGVGKSALVHRFLHEVREHHEGAVLLSGRCYERESVPYKALDSLVDALSRYLRQLPRSEATDLVPANVLALARLFPALRRVQSVAGAERRVLEIPDSREQRRRAFAALRDLLSRLAARHPLLLWIDDLQWGDLDSAALLADLLRPPDPPAMMLVGSFRSEERATSPLLRTLLEPGELAAWSSDRLEVQELEIEPLAAPEAEAMALELLGDRSDSARRLAASIARESGGSPFFIDELVRHAQAEAGFGERGERDLSAAIERALSADTSLESLIQSRVERLQPEARRLLEVVAVAGRPVDVEAARQAAELGAETQGAIAVLRATSLCRLLGSRQHEEIETYHDRIREGVVRSLGEGRLARLHRRLAEALVASGRADPETLAVHFLEAGDRARAAEFATAAADEAADALAFDRAARLYRIALDLEVAVGEPLRRLQVKLGDALSNAGRGAEAAAVYLVAAEGAKAAEALELRRRAAEQQLISGRIDQGLETVRAVLASIGMGFPATPRATLRSLVWLLVRLRFRGLGFRERDTTQISDETLISIDTCWSVSIGLGTVDTIRGMTFGKRHLLLALRAGEPYRIARALAIESGYSATGGTRSRRRTALLVREARRLAERVNQPHALGLASMTAGMAAYLEGRWRQAYQLLERGERVLRDQCTGVTWELDTAITYQLRALLFVGDLASMRRRLPRALKDVAERGDLYAEVNLRTRIAWFLHLAAGDPDAALAEVDQAIARWSPHGFHIQHYWHMTGLVEIALFRGDLAGAWTALTRLWPRMEGSLLLRIQLTRVEALHTHGRAALAAAMAGDAAYPRRRMLEIVERSVRRIEKESLPWGNPLAQLVRAGVKSLEERDREAVDHLVAAAAGFESADMQLYAAVARLRRGQLGADPRSRDLATEARATIAAHGVADVDRIAEVLAPGLWSRWESASVPSGFRLAGIR